jgi:lipopolysaccharide/colanic/teichoic acid biosynthesis glycosyltransferase
MSAKRVFDIVISALLLLLCLPLLAGIACLIWLDSPGPAIFKQRRYGRNRIPFMVFKFRTMQIGAEKFGVPTVKNDWRITRIGKFLRRAHLDELPQLWNVVKGEMSMVGPRAISMEGVAQVGAKLLDHEKRYYGHRFDVLPGITGPVQVLGREKAFSGGIRQALSLDLAYVKNHDLLLDIKIILKTALAVCKLQGI